MKNLMSKTDSILKGSLIRDKNYPEKNKGNGFRITT